MQVSLAGAVVIEKRALVAPAHPATNWTFTGCYTYVVSCP